ncbi:glycosyltransferase family 4 protein [Anaeromassilibacillus senegalensis]|uniref:glycosyltransferase family 4 protein n=1 Tax=Anaeromassilibacillus senegalensis TaxID=1673717 RepID=UPI00068233F0|nr:glycosyltransferase family 4 protein [Anaeromassilibacillus senegalensis]
MKVLIVHNFHRSGSASGDDQVFRHESALLEAEGVTVLRYSVKNDSFDQQNGLGKMFSALSMFWSWKAYREIRNICKTEKPDVVHIHTFFPLLSPSVFVAAHRSSAKVVQTLHDTRYVCPNATSMRDAELCNACADGKYFRMCKYKCFKGSRLQSLIVACIFKIHRLLRIFYKDIDTYVCLNDVQMELLEQAGFDRNKMIKKYNSVSQPVPIETSLPDLPERFVVYYGRIGEEKGMDILLNVWKRLPEIPLVVMGDGPLAEDFQKFMKSNQMTNVQYLGYTPHDKCIAIVQKAEFVVFPSVWYEGCSMVIIESFSLKKPVVATDIGFMKEAIQSGYNGLKCRRKDVADFTAKIRYLWEHPQEAKEIGENAYRDFQKNYTEEADVRKLLEIYER